MHQGLISTEKDALVLQHTTNFKSVELNEKHLFISVKDKEEGSLLNREITKFTKEQEFDITTFAPGYEAS